MGSFVGADTSRRRSRRHQRARIVSQRRGPKGVGSQSFCSSSLTTLPQNAGDESHICSFEPQRRASNPVWKIGWYREALALAAFLSPSLAAMFTYAPQALANAGRRFVRGRIILAVTIAAGAVMAPALAQNSESAPTTAASTKPKLKTPAGGTLVGVVAALRKFRAPAAS
jgi:hypothetical protein